MKHSRNQGSLLAPAPDGIRAARGGGLALVTHAIPRPDLEAGLVEAITSAFGIEFEASTGMFKTDQVTIDPGAFDQSLVDNPTAPIMWEHAWDAGPIGRTLEEEATDVGLHIFGRLFLEHELPARIYKAMLPAEPEAPAPLDEWSIGFWPLQLDREVRATDADPEAPDLVHYQVIDRAEHSVVLRGANPGTETIRVNGRGAVVDGFGVDAVPCTFPSEFTVGGRTYRPAGDLPVRAAAALPDVITLAGVAYRVAAPLELHEVEAPAKAAAAADPRLARLLRHGPVRDWARASR